MRDTLGADPSGFTADAAEKLLTDLRDLKDNFRADDLQEEFLKRNGFDDVLKGLQEVFNVGQKELEGLGAEDAKRKMEELQLDELKRKHSVLHLLGEKVREASARKQRAAPLLRSRAAARGGAAKWEDSDSEGEPAEPKEPKEPKAQKRNTCLLPQRT